MLAITMTETIQAVQTFGVQKILDSNNTQIVFSWNPSSNIYDVILTDDYKQLPPNSYNTWAFIVRGLDVDTKLSLKKYI